MYRTIISTSAVVAGLLIASLVDAQPPAAEQGGAAVESTEAQRFAALEKTLSGATLVGTGDDDDPPNVGGPFGDPNYSFAIANTGWYATAVGNFLGNPGVGEYNITITGQTPEPGALSLLALGGLALLRRRR